MNKKDIENMIKESFAKATPDVLVSALEQCSDIQGAVIQMTENKKRRPVLRVALVVAAVVVVLTTTVAAISLPEVVKNYTEQNRDRILGTAMTYIVESTDDFELRNSLANFILSGLSYDSLIEEEDVNLGLSGLKPVFHVSLKVGGYAYKIDVDASTNVVISCESEVDEGWEKHLDEAGTSEGGDTYISKNVVRRIISEHLTFSNPDIAREQGLITVAKGDLPMDEARDIATAYALSPDSISEIERCSYDISSYTVENYLTDPMSYIVQCVHGGYVYEYSVDSATGDLKELCVVDDPYFDPEQSQHPKHRHSHNNEVIGSSEAKLIACQAYEKLGYSPDVCKKYSFYYNDAELLEAFGYSNPFYGVSIVNNDLQVSFDIDAYTGEVLSVSDSAAEASQNSDSSSHDIQLPSTQAPDGMISEAEACAVALEDAAVFENDISERSIKLKDDGHGHSIYEIRFIDINGSSFEYEINAVTGDIVSYAKAINN